MVSFSAPSRHVRRPVRLPFLALDGPGIHFAWKWVKRDIKSSAAVERERERERERGREGRTNGRTVDDIVILARERERERERDMLGWDVPP